MTKTTGKRMAAKIMAITLIVSMAGASAACRKKAKIPSKEEFVKEHKDDADPHGMDRFDFSREELIDAWGEPETDKRYGAASVWKCGDKFIIAGTDPDDPGKIGEMYVSVTQELVYLFTNASIVYVCIRNNGVTDPAGCYMLGEMDLDRGSIEDPEMGTILQIEFDGYYLETYPGQFSMICSIKTAGKVPDSEIPALEQQAQYIRDNYTGEK